MLDPVPIVKTTHKHPAHPLDNNPAFLLSIPIPMLTLFSLHLFFFMPSLYFAHLYDIELPTSNPCTYMSRLTWGNSVPINERKDPKQFKTKVHSKQTIENVICDHVQPMWILRSMSLSLSGSRFRSRGVKVVDLAAIPRSDAVADERILFLSLRLLCKAVGLRTSRASFGVIFPLPPLYRQVGGRAGM